MTNHERVVAGLRSRLRACFNQGLKTDPSMKGVATIVIDVGPSGETTSVAVTGTGSLAPQTLACMKTSATRLMFDAPGAGGGQVTLKATCAPP